MTGTKSASLASRITEAREAQALTKRELAARLDVSERTIWNYENGARTPRGFRLRQLARVTKRPIEFFTEDVAA